jgi:hypothetical protein
MIPLSLSLSDVLVLFGLFAATALGFLLMGWRFGRESSGRGMFVHPLSEALHEAAAVDEADPWNAVMHGCPALGPAAADAREAGMAFFAPRGHTDQATPRDGLSEGE